MLNKTNILVIFILFTIGCVNLPETTAENVEESPTATIDIDATVMAMFEASNSKETVKKDPSADTQVNITSANTEQAVSVNLEATIEAFTSELQSIKSSNNDTVELGNMQSTIDALQYRLDAEKKLTDLGQIADNLVKNPEIIPTFYPESATLATDSIKIVIDTPLGPSALDPWTASKQYQNHITHNIAQPISFLGPDFVDTLTAGFSNWKMIDGGNAWEIELTRGMTFHNGEKWDAHAAAYSINYLDDCEDCTPLKEIGESYAKVIDDYTISWHVQQGHSMLPRYWQYTTFRAPKHHADTKFLQPITGETIGWGPYKFKSFSADNILTIEKFNDYYDNPNIFLNQAGTINEAQFSYLDTALYNLKTAMIQTGQADIVSSLPADLAGSLESSERGGWAIRLSGDIFTVTQDTIWHPELKKLKVRQALAHAIDCEALALSLFGPTSRCSSGPAGIPSTIGVTETNWKPKYPYDPAKAKQLLEEADYNFDNYITYITRSGSYPKDVELSESLGIMWGQAGINVKILISDPSVWRKFHISGSGSSYSQAIMSGMSHENAVAAVHAGFPPYGSLEGRIGMALTISEGEYFDWGHQIDQYMNCASRTSLNCDADSHTLGQNAMKSSGAERKRLLEESYQVFTDRVYHIPLMEIISVWGINKDLDFTNMPGGDRILVNTIRYR